MSLPGLRSVHRRNRYPCGVSPLPSPAANQVKAVSRNARLEALQIESKSGGKSGDFSRSGSGGEEDFDVERGRRSAVYDSRDIRTPPH